MSKQKIPETIKGVEYGRRLIEESVMHRNDYCASLEEIVNEMEFFLLRFLSGSLRDPSSMRLEAEKTMEKIRKVKEQQ